MSPAFARVQVSYQPFILLGPQGPGGSFITYLRTQAGQIMSRRVLWPALKSDEVKRLNQTMQPVTCLLRENCSSRSLSRARA